MKKILNIITKEYSIKNMLILFMLTWSACTDVDKMCFQLTLLM